MEQNTEKPKATARIPRFRRASSQPSNLDYDRKRVVLKSLTITPLDLRSLEVCQKESSSFRLARARLHVATVPDSLPCREEQFAEVYRLVETAINQCAGACIYISGTPGTGKTATVREVVGSLSLASENAEVGNFTYVEINGLKITDPHQCYSLLWEALKGERVSSAYALTLLEQEFQRFSPTRLPCVVLMDELDQLATKNQTLMYNFFNWPGLEHSRLIILAVANTMDLPERTLSNKISSRLGLTRLQFPGYTHDQLMKIIQSRLNGVPGNIVDRDAIEFASRKVAAVSGDARRALDICRRAVELAEDGFEGARLGSFHKVEKNVTLPKQQGKVTIATVQKAIYEVTANPLQRYVKSLPGLSKLLLSSLLTRLQRTGIAESTYGDVLNEAARSLANGNGHPSYLSCRLRSKNLARCNILDMAGGAAVELQQAGILLVDSVKLNRASKLKLAIPADEVSLALAESS